MMTGWEREAESESADHDQGRPNGMEGQPETANRASFTPLQLSTRLAHNDVHYNETFSTYESGTERRFAHQVRRSIDLEEG